MTFKLRLGGPFLLSSLSFCESNRRKKSLGSLLNSGFSAQGETEDRSREPQDANSLELKDTPAEKTNLASGLTNSVSGGTEFVALLQIKIKLVGVCLAKWICRQLNIDTNIGTGAGFSSSASGNLAFGLGTSGQKGLEVSRVDWSEISSRRSAGVSSVGTGCFGWELGARRGDAAFGFRASGLSSFGDRGFSSRTVEGSDTSLRIGNTFVGDSSGNLESNSGAFGQQGFGVNELGGNRMSGSASVGAGFKGLGSDVSSSGDTNLRNGNTFAGDSSGNLESSLGAFGQQGFRINELGGDRMSGSTSVGGVTSSSDYSTSGPLSTPGKGTHIPEATPKYSETNTTIGEVSTWGKGAYKAFNGHVFSFESSCTYSFCRHCVESGGDFNIEIKRNNDSEIEKITVILDSNVISIAGDVILVNGER
ncbi:PREDICTED: protein rtoA-like [Lipotes vexillifer]|uniref:Protein rtoA-like n=1 Tax=Lipotes vexillifer TaxID=118797 RepID=A0A340WGG2_LIPVE|nr:PREDICTED: protein rtoA-like [Lipotes vexillifer]